MEGEDGGRGRERMERGKKGGGRERKIKREEILLLAKVGIHSCWEMNCVPLENMICRDLGSLRM